MPVTVDPVIPPDLLPFTNRRDLDPSTDYGVGWDSASTPPRLKRRPGRWDYDYGSARVWNLMLDFGTSITDVPDDTGGTANSGVKLALALTSMAAGDVLVVPPGTYNLADRTGGYPCALASLRIIGIGKPTLNFGGQAGITLTNPSIAALELQGLAFTNVVGEVVAASAATQQIRKVRVRGCDFTSVTASGGATASALRLQCMVQDVSVSDVVVDGVISAASAFGLYLGLDDTVTARPSQPGDASFTFNAAASGLDFEGGIVVSGVHVRNVSSSSTAFGTQVNGVRAYGWQVHVADSDFTRVFKGNQLLCEGVYVRAHMGAVHDCDFVDAGSGSMVRMSVVGYESATLGAGVLSVHSNHFRSKDRNDCAVVVGVYGPNCRVRDNYFTRCAASTALVSAVPLTVLSTGAWASGVEVHHNTIYGGTWPTGVQVRGAYSDVSDNRFLYPQGPINFSSSFAAIRILPSGTVSVDPAVPTLPQRYRADRNTLCFATSQGSPVLPVPLWPSGYTGGGQPGRPDLNACFVLFDLSSTDAHVSGMQARGNELQGSVPGGTPIWYGIAIYDGESGFVHRDVDVELVWAAGTPAASTLDFPTWTDCNSVVSANQGPNWRMETRFGGYLNATTAQSIGHHLSGAHLRDTGAAAGQLTHTFSEPFKRGTRYKFTRTRPGGGDFMTLTPFVGSSFLGGAAGQPLSLLTQGSLEIVVDDEGVGTVENDSAEWDFE